MQSTVVLVDAAAEVAAAKTARAEEQAPFEYTAAEAYLHKAREEQSYAEFEVAVRFAEQSRDCARVARMMSEAQTKKDMGGTRATARTRAKCLAGPDRDLPPAAEEPGVQLKQKPGSKKTAAEPKDPPKAKKPIAPKKKAAEPKDPEPEEEEDLPAGDEPLPDGDT